MRVDGKLGIVIVIVVIVFSWMGGLLLQSHMRAERNPTKGVWDGVDTTNIRGVKLDSCRCVYMNGKVYKVEIKTETVERIYYLTDIKAPKWKKKAE